MKKNDLSYIDAMIRYAMISKERVNFLLRHGVNLEDEVVIKTFKEDLDVLIEDLNRILELEKKISKTIKKEDEFLR